MSEKRLSAQPIREGISEISGVMKVVWRDFRWNTGKVVRDWHIDPEVANNLEIEVRPIGRRPPKGGKPQ